MNLKQIWAGFKGVLDTMSFVYFMILLAIFLYINHHDPRMLDATIALPMHVIIVLILFAVLQNAIAGVKAIRRLIQWGRTT